MLERHIRKGIVFLTVLALTSPTSEGRGIEFQDKSIDNWSLEIGANAKEFHYDFCRYNATSQGLRCKSFPSIASVDIAVCNCTFGNIQDGDPGSFGVTIQCSSDSDGCPRRLNITYEHRTMPKTQYSQAEKSNAGAVNSVSSLLVAYQLAFLLTFSLFFKTS